MSEHVSARRAQTRERLLDAAIVLFAEKGVLGASVEEICEQAGFTRGAFYSNFETKDDLCLAVMQRQGQDSLRATEQATASVADETPSADTDALIDRAVRVFISTQPTDTAWMIAHAELRLYAARNPAMREGLIAMKEQMGAAIAAVLTQALERVGARLTLPLDQAFDVLHGVYEHGALSAVIEGVRADEERSARLAAVLRAMIATDCTPC